MALPLNALPSLPPLAPTFGSVQAAGTAASEQQPAAESSTLVLVAAAAAGEL